MKYILSILDGMEKGIEITLESDTIYSIGTQDDSDFYVRKNSLDFLVYFRVVGDIIEWWSQKKVAASINGKDFSLSLNKIEAAANEIIEVGGRQFGVFEGKESLAQVQESLEPKLPAVSASEPVLDLDATESPSLKPASLSESTLVDVSFNADSDLMSTQNVDLPPASETVTDEIVIGEVATKVEPTEVKPSIAIALDPKVIAAAQQDFSAQSRKKNHQDTLTSKEKSKSKQLELLKLAPFIIGIIILITYGVMNRTGSIAPPNPVNMSPEEKQKRDNQNTMMNDSTVDQIDAMLAEEGIEASIEASIEAQGVDTKTSEFIASGSEYNTTDKWKSMHSVEPTDEHALESLRKKVNEGTIQPIEAAEVLFPDEKMMTLIKEMLDTAGAEGIDVRFDRGSYDVFGYVMDDEKWQRIFKILTFDLDLTKVQFSVETSISLIKKFESLLKKFNLSDYATLSLGSNGQIFAKTYYPPALEGLWYTIKSRFESKYGQYTDIKEYRAHIGWINIVKVSFDQPSYVLLADGRRLVEGSIWGGSSVLDKIYEDSIRVISGSTQARYYVINKSRALAGSELSDR